MEGRKKSMFREKKITKNFDPEILMPKITKNTTFWDLKSISDDFDDLCTIMNF